MAQDQLHGTVRHRAVNEISIMRWRSRALDFSA